MQPMNPTPRTAFGLSIEPDERVVFAHVPPPVAAGDRAVLVLIGLFLLPILVGLFILVHAFRKKSDRVWLVTNKRSLNVAADGTIRNEVRHEQIAQLVMRSGGTFDVQCGATWVALPTSAKIDGQELIAILRSPGLVQSLPGLPVPP